MPLPDLKEVEDLLTQVESFVEPMSPEAHATNNLVDHLEGLHEDNRETRLLLDLSMRILRQLRDRNDRPIPVYGAPPPPEYNLSGFVGVTTLSVGPGDCDNIPQVDYHVVLSEVGSNPVAVGRALRRLFGWPPSQVFAVMRGPLPYRLGSGMSRAEADDWIRELEAAGAKAEHR